MNYQDRITRDAQICGREPVVKGTRVTLGTVLVSLVHRCTNIRMSRWENGQRVSNDPDVFDLNGLQNLDTLARCTAMLL
jgi:hypothetical protein